jgi:MFS family permease
MTAGVFPPAPPHLPSGDAMTDVLGSALAKARRRLLPFLFLLYIVAYLDRINVGFASLQMNAALGFSATTYGLGAGVFFLSYAAFEIPSNVILARIGARPWIARIMISWGIVSSATMFVQGPKSFYALRFLLGMAEAGFFPGIIFYLTGWFPGVERARTIALFMTATLLAGVIGGPISGALMSLGGAAGLAGWQWLFLLEGIPAIVLGVAVLRALTEGPQDASWLSSSERSAILARLSADDRECAERDPGARMKGGQGVPPAQGMKEPGGSVQALRDRRTWLLALVYFTVPVTLYGIGFWLPQILKSTTSASDFGVSLLSAIPYAAGAGAMVAVGRRSDRSGQRRWLVCLPALAGAAGLVLTPLRSDAWWSVVTLSLALAGLASMFGPFWALATSRLRGVGAAVAIALINAIGNTGGFVGPYLVGAINDATHDFAAGLLTIAGMLAAGAALVLLVDD